MRRISILLASSLLATALGGCKQSEPDIGTPPVANLQGVWMFANRQLGCTKTAATFGHSGLYEIHIDNSPRRKIFDITQFAVGGGIVLMDVEKFEPEPDTPLKMTLAVAKDSLKLTELTTRDGVSFKNPPANIAPKNAERMKNVFRIAQMHLTMQRCPDDEA